MAKTSGLGERLYVAAFDLSGDIGALGTISDTRNQQDVTGINKFAMQRLGLLRDSQLVYSGFFSTDAGGFQRQVRSVPQDALFTWATGITHGSPTGSIEANTSDFGETRGPDGSLVVNATAMSMAGNGMEWGVLLEDPDHVVASAGALTGVDDGYKAAYITGVHSPGVALPLPSQKGLAAYLHVISIGSGTATVHVQHSTDDLTYTDLVVFSGASGATSQRVATTATTNVDQYLRVNVTGTFTNLAAAVAAVRHI